MHAELLAKYGEASPRTIMRIVKGI